MHFSFILRIMAINRAKISFIGTVITAYLIVKINDLLDNTEDSSVLRTANTKEYINSIFTSVSVNHPELNQAITNKVVSTSNYIKPSILIVDDSTIIRNSLKRIFEKDYNII